MAVHARVGLGDVAVILRAGNHVVQTSFYGLAVFPSAGEVSTCEERHARQSGDAHVSFVTIGRLVSVVEFVPHIGRPRSVGILGAGQVTQTLLHRLGLFGGDFERGVGCLHGFRFLGLRGRAGHEGTAGESTPQDAPGPRGGAGCRSGLHRVHGERGKGPYQPPRTSESRE